MYIWSKIFSFYHETSNILISLLFKDKSLMTDSPQNFTVMSKTKLELLVLWKTVISISINAIIFERIYLFHRTSNQSLRLEIDIVVKMIYDI